jgi:hypothetical protein
MKTQIATILALSLLATTASAGPTDKKLAQFVGRWEGTSNFTIRGETLTWKVTWACERAAVGPGIACSFIGVSGDRRIEEAHLVGYDKASDTYHLFSVNSWGEAYDHAAKWTDAAKVSFVHDGTRDGKPLRETYGFAWKGKTITMTGGLSVDGKDVGSGVTKMDRVP